MDFIKAQLDRIQQQLNGLNASQKMLTAALVTIMLITVVWWGRYAGEAEMVPLLNQSLSAADIGRMQDALAGKGMTSQVVGDKLLVHADRRIEALSTLTFARAMPRVDDGFKDLLTQMNPFDSVSKDEKLWNHHKQSFLSQVIGGMKGVLKADVIIDPTTSRRIDGNVEPSASVAITLEEGVRDRQKLVGRRRAAGRFPGRPRVRADYRRGERRRAARPRHRARRPRQQRRPTRIPRAKRKVRGREGSHRLPLHPRAGREGDRLAQHDHDPNPIDRLQR